MFIQPELGEIVVAELADGTLQREPRFALFIDGRVQHEFLFGLQRLGRTLVKNRGAVLGRVHHALLMFGGLGQRRVEDRRKWDVIERELARDQVGDPALFLKDIPAAQRSEEHTSELQSLMRISYAVFCLKQKNKKCHCTTNT